MYKLVLLRHGESVWNKSNTFTGWTDVALSEKGEKQAFESGIYLKKYNFEFDLAYTSVLKRAINTLWIVLNQMDLCYIPVIKNWRLNERHYGALQGLNKKETAQKMGEEQVHLWRRSYDIAPPSLTKDDKRYPGKDNRYKDLKENDLPLTESLKDTVERFLPAWKKEIAPLIKLGKRILISAHGNSLRALVKYIEEMSNDEVINLNIPTGLPLVYELDENLKPIKHYYFGDEKRVKKAMQRFGKITGDK